ncbi:MAG: WYL domain-containing protein [bacterium]|nr:WYL domain-containing protein [bacterium]
MAFKDLKHAQRERLEYLDRLLFWEGAATRASLIKRFGISNAQAAIDFRNYLGDADENALQYDASSRQYLATEDFTRRTDSASPEELPELLRGASAPLFDQLPDLKRTQNIRVLQPVYRAMRSKNAIEIVYQSMRDPEPVKRMIAPKRFVSDGVRIHIRAWCFLREAYRDFHPARIDPDHSFKKHSETGDIPADDEWYTWSIWKLIPHSRLSEAQKKAVRIEFDITGDYLEVRIRKALNLYAERRWGLKQEAPRLECLSVDHVPITEDETNAD